MCVVPPRGVSLFHQRAELAFGDTRLCVLVEGTDGGVGQFGADPHPLELLGGLLEAQARVGVAEVHDVGGEVLQPCVAAKVERPQDTDPLVAGPPALELLERSRRRLSGPANVRLGCDNLRVRDVVVEIDEQNVFLAWRHDDHGLARHRPARQPADRRAETVPAVHERVRNVMLSHHRFELRAAGCHLFVREARVRLGVRSRA